MVDLKPALSKVADGEILTQAEAELAFSMIMSGAADVPQVAALLMGMRLRGERVDEIVGGARVLRSKADLIDAPENSIDTCGTGGDSLGTYNISTTAAILAAACGATIAKHGNRSVSSKSGSADVLNALGINLEISQADNETCLKQHGIAFMFAPSHHRAMRHVGPIRASMGLRTIFNLLGPLANPAMTKRQLLGVFDKKWLLPMAETLRELGSDHVWVVHGSDGLDELTITGDSYVVELKDGKIREFTISPKDYGLDIAPLEEIQGGLAEENAEAMLTLMKGKKSGYRDIVLLNAAATLLVAGVVDDLRAGVEIAAKAIDQGTMFKKYREWADFTQAHKLPEE
ncbi:anthranilate phosphoribosyltransferase [Temperatibacter marinus]|uniref:Anthranilate phosphoribosyltransferase n=1 Tax=Temperatibacter marinus TaxID=1456591 RepID=A0AA52ECR5_9PROT|nr:anthranilate phosphoribosyltransferase [Temperatibacter marinus]WND02371.1 anthranilate phosphoribosyltransferase [Temperatibacter marinus]